MSDAGSQLRVLLAAALPLALFTMSAQTEDGQVNTIKDAFARLYSCWKPPPLSRTNPIDITVIVSFNRAGQIIGHPQITYESALATDDDRLQYRIAVMKTLQRCTPMPFTEGMAGAVAGHPLAIQFHTKRPSPPATEKQAWLSLRIL